MSIKIVIFYNCGEQQLLDCSTAFGTKGCAGGWYEKAWRYMISSKVSQMSNASYPYIAKTAVRISLELQINF